MKPNNIIYYNESSGLTELCTNSDIKKGKFVEVYGRSYFNERVAEKLVLDRKVTFTGDIQFEEVFEKVYSLLLGIPSSPKKSEKVSCVFQVIKETENMLIVSHQEIRRAHEPINIAKIKFLKQDDLVINNEKGKAAIIIYDIQVFDGLQETKAALGQFALGVGLYLLSFLDGDWNRLKKSIEDIITSPEEKVAELKKQLAQCMLERDSYRVKVDELIRNMDHETSVLKKTIFKQSAEIKELKALNKKYIVLGNKNIEKEEKLVEVVDVTEKRDFLADMQQAFVNKKICIVGGNRAWQSKIRKCFSKVITIENKNFDSTKVQDSKLLIVNTNNVGHSCTKKAVNIAEATGIKICYTSKYNLNNMAEEILSELVL